MSDVLTRSLNQRQASGIAVPVWLVRCRWQVSIAMSFGAQTSAVLVRGLTPHRSGVVSQARKFRCTDEEPIMKSDSEIERDIRDELKWDPDLLHLTNRRSVPCADIGA
jgi:hypothetical protein